MILLELYWVFLRIGSLTFGGGYAMISLIQEEVVQRGYCSEMEFADMVALSQMTPGPVALNTATYLGKTAAGIPGALAATLGLITPAVVITSLVLWLMGRVKSNRWSGAIKGIRAAAAGLIFAAIWFFAETSLFISKPMTGSILAGNLHFQWGGFQPLGVGIFIYALLAVWKLKIRTHWVIFSSLGLGALGYWVSQAGLW